MREYWASTLTLIGLGILLGVVFGEVSLVSGVRRYTGREATTLNPELALGTFVGGATCCVLFVGLLAARRTE